MNSRYDLLERTAVFGESIITFCLSLPKTVITVPLINQLVKSGTSIGANYTEADNAESKKDFKHKIGICRKESKEAGFSLRMIKTAIPEKSTKVEILLQEAHEFNLIFNAINHNTHLDY